MKGVSTKGLEDLISVRNRLVRVHGMDRISVDEFLELYTKLNEIIKLVGDLDETLPHEEDS